MPFVSEKQRKCKYCDKPAKINYFGIKRRHKGYLRTCSDEECLNKQYSDKIVNQKKACITRNEKIKCFHCGNEVLKEQNTQKWCRKCVPDNKARKIIQRYDVSHPEYLEMLSKNLDCPICLRKLDNPVIDHNHKTGMVRGMICNHCNVALNIIEDEVKLKRAIIYLNL